MNEFVNPYKFDEDLRTPDLLKVECKDNFHPSSLIKYEGPLMIQICLDPKCAKVRAICEHQIMVYDEDTTEEEKELVYTPKRRTKSICTWNDDGTVLTCQYCGVDGT